MLLCNISQVTEVFSPRPFDALGPVMVPLLEAKGHPPQSLVWPAASGCIEIGSRPLEVLTSPRNSGFGVSRVLHSSRTSSRQLKRFASIKDTWLRISDSGFHGVGLEPAVGPTRNPSSFED